MPRSKAPVPNDAGRSKNDGCDIILTDRLQQSSRVVDPSGGANQIRVREYNERLVLSIVRRHESLPKSEIARRTGLSPQTVSVIMRALEQDGLLLRGSPQRGKVGQPSIPMSLDPEGAFSVGLKIGRRSADLILLDFLGSVRASHRTTYPYPRPAKILDFTKKGLTKLEAKLQPHLTDRIAGIGIAMPFELWNWADKLDAPKEQMQAWRHVDFKAEIAKFSALPSFVQNDATAACGAELVFGRGAELDDFVYFFIGNFIGGGVVLNQAVYSGRSGNAGALGSMPVVQQGHARTQLIDHASIAELENRLADQQMDTDLLWGGDSSWQSLNPVLGQWISDTAYHLATAIIASCAVIDFAAAIIDGGFPEHVRSDLVAATRGEIAKMNLQGITAPQILTGSIGSSARAIGGACLPLYSRYLLDQNVLFKNTV